MRRVLVATLAAGAGAVSLSGCMWQTASGLGESGSDIVIVGQVAGFPVTGPMRAQLTFAGGGGCVSVTGTVTLTDGTGDQLREAVDLRLCAGQDPAAGITGRYTVLGGTGRFEGASGEGTTTLRSSEGPVGLRRYTLDQLGLLILPEAASAGARRRTTMTARLRGHRPPGR